MNDIQKFSDFVKAQSEFHVRMAKKHSNDSKRVAMHTQTSQSFTELREFIESCKKSSAPINPNKQSLTWDEIAELPEELVAELSISDTDKTEFNILAVVEKLGGVASLDRIIIGYFQLTGEIVKRAQMNNRIYRMIQKKALFPIAGKKGVYALSAMSEDNLGIFG